MRASPFAFRCFSFSVDFRYGIDIPSTDELITDPTFTHEQNALLVANKLGLDGPVIYQTLSAIEAGFNRMRTLFVFPPLVSNIVD